MSFTIGPWQVEDRTVYALQNHGWRKGVQQFENRFSASVQGAKCPDDELLANAVLMAAAPELLSALNDILVGMEASGGWSGDDGLFEAGMAAYKKATGGAA